MQKIQAPDRLNLGCGTEQQDDWHNVDVSPECDPDQVVDLDEVPWPWPDGSVTKIVANHVFEHLEDIEATLQECERILKPGGLLVTRWPVGVDASADPDHKRVWTWRTPEMYCGDRHWDVDVGLEVVDRHVELWSHAPGHLGGLTNRVVQRLLGKYGPGPWCFGVPMTSGEFTVVFEA